MAGQQFKDLGLCSKTVIQSFAASPNLSGTKKNSNKTKLNVKNRDFEETKSTLNLNVIFLNGSC